MGQPTRAVSRKPTWLYIYCGIVLFFLITPVLIVIPMSFSGARYLEFPPSSLSLRWYRQFFSSPEWLHATWNSLRIALGTTVVSVAMGFLAALGISQSRSRRVRLLRVGLTMPMMIPTIIIAVAVYLVYAKWRLTGTYAGLVIAHSCLALPYVVVVISSALSGIDSRLYDAARSLGAGHFTAVRLVVMPLMKPAILSSMLFAFMTSFDEVTVSLFISRPETTTLPKMMFDHLRFEIHPVIAAISSMLIALTLAALTLNALSQNRSARMVGRQ